MQELPWRKLAVRHPRRNKKKEKEFRETRVRSVPPKKERKNIELWKNLDVLLFATLAGERESQGLWGKKSEKSWHSEETFFFLFFFFFIIIIILDSVEERFTTFWKISQKKHYYYDYYAVSERV